MNRFLLIGGLIAIPLCLFAGSDEASYFGKIEGHRNATSYTVNNTPEQVTEDCKRTLYKSGRLDQFIPYSNDFIQGCTQGFYEEIHTWKRN
ncbi:MAG: hypothetical protein J0647_04375 [Campylobacteraceae bacterium]|nr:hypothetical protein [Campylobacteraceae bacterium]